MNSNITIDSCYNISIIDYGNALLPNPHHYLTLNNVLHALKFINNLVTIRKLIIDNDISVEFHSFGFFVKVF